MKQRLIAKITTVLQHAPLVRNLARQKFVAQFSIGLIKSRNVQFGEVAQHLNDGAKVASNETRIQDFFREANLNYLVLAQLIISLLPAQGKLRLCLDRTEWDFGRCQVNILLVTVGRAAFQGRSIGNCSATAVVIPTPLTAPPCSRSASNCWAATGLGWCWATGNLWANNGSSS